MARDLEFVAVYGKILYATARPFAVKVGVGTLGNPAENVVYIIQVKNDATGNWDNLTNVMRVPVAIGSTSIVIIDPSQQLSDSLTTTQRVTGGGAQKLVNNLRMWRIIATPEYYDGDGLLSYNTDMAQWVVSLEHYCTDAAPPHMMCASAGEAEYLKKIFISTNAGGYTNYFRFATFRPDRIHRCEIDSETGFNDYISYYNSGGLRLRCTGTLYFEDGYSTNAHLSDEVGDYGHISVGVGTTQIQDYLGAGTWSSLMTHGRIVKIEYWIQSGDYGDNLTNIMTTLVSNRNCCIENTQSIEVIWKNRLGGNDTFVLKGAVGTEESHEFELFERRQGMRLVGGEDPTTSAFNPSSYQNQWHQGSTNIAKIGIKANKKLEVTSQYMAKPVVDWVAEIATAPRVYIRESYKDIQPWTSRLTGEETMLQQIIIETTEVTTKEKKTGLGQLELDILYANPITTQRI